MNRIIGEGIGAYNAMYRELGLDALILD